MRIRTASVSLAVALHFLHQAPASLIARPAATRAFVNGPLRGANELRSLRNIRAQLRRGSGLRHAGLNERADRDLARQSGTRAESPHPFVDALGPVLAGCERLALLFRSRAGFHPFFFVLI